MGNEMGDFAVESVQQKPHRLVVAVGGKGKKKDEQ